MSKPITRHPYHSNITVEFALRQARLLKHGPFPKEGDDTPTVDEAISLIHEMRRTCGFNWITGACCEEVLRLSQGEKVELS